LKHQIRDRFGSRVRCCYCLALSFYSCTCRVPTISELNLAISPYCSEGEDGYKEFFDEEF
jgi:hypothetical protein